MALNKLEDISPVISRSCHCGVCIECIKQKYFAAIALKVTIDNYEWEAINEALLYFRGNRTHTALALNMCLRTLRNKIAVMRARGIRVIASERCSYSTEKRTPKAKPNTHPIVTVSE